MGRGYVLEECVDIDIIAPINPLKRSPVLSPTSVAHLVNVDREACVSVGDPRVRRGISVDITQQRAAEKEVSTHVNTA